MQNRQTQGKKRILIIEDDADFRELLRIHLSLAGYALEVAEDGVEGGKALLEHTPDLVVSDVDMPFLSGFELLSLMRAEKETASIPVILLSGSSNDETMSEAMKLGAADFLTKPVTLEDLMRAIRACLSKNEAKAAQA
jgi:DNA-binding response OmpR family regulator